MTVISDLPKGILSERVLESIKGRRLLALVFTTFRLEPNFFEAEILPAFIDQSFSHALPIRLVQLEETLRAVPAGIAVYYDQAGLVADGAGAKLDVRRIPVRYDKGIFHPKNAFVLVEEVAADADGRHPRSLLCLCASANLTRAGWWENVEVAHIEEVRSGDRSHLRDEVMNYLDALVGIVEGQRADHRLQKRHVAVNAIRRFLQDEVASRENATSNGRLYSRLITSQPGMQISAQIGAIVGGSLRGMNLEIFSPYFDDGPACKPLHAFIAAFSPAQVRIHLPLNDRAEALCDAATFEAVAAMVGVRWGTLPRDFLRLGASEDAGGRSVHAKVYRFFEPLRGGREVLYVGSANLTSAGCGGGNLESGFLVETTGKGKPDWWLAVSTVAPTSFGCEHEDEGAAKTCATLLALRYFWNSGTAEAKWTGVNVSPTLVISQGGITAFTLAAIEPGEWRTLAPADAERLAEVLVQSSLLSVDGESDEPRFLLVQEEGMSHRPSILLDLSAADILRYWSLLSVAQRAAFIEARSRVAGDDDPLVTALQPIAVMDTMFDRLAGIFHAFECLRESVLKALGEKQYRDADYRLFGRKYDSLPTLLEQVLADHRHGRGETVEHYVVAMSARQLFDEIKWADAEYWKTHHADVQAIQQQLSELKDLRQALAAGKPEMPAFLDWFDHWFLRRAEPLSPEAT